MATQTPRATGLPNRLLIAEKVLNRYGPVQGPTAIAAATMAMMMASDPTKGSS
jgi:hypothetical protein